MGLFGRVATSTRNMVKALFTPAEDPRQRRGSPEERLAELLARVREGIGEVEASKKRLQRQAEQISSKLTQWEDQARRHLGAGREDLARQALQGYQAILKGYQDLEQQIAEVEQEERMLTLGEQRLAAKMEALHTRQEAVTARQAAAEAQVRISEVLTGLSGELSDLSLGLERAQQKTEEMQARAAAIDELVEAGALEDPSRAKGDVVQRELLKLGAGHAVEEKLEAMRKELGRERTPPPSGGGP